jgi:GNAT superfamily N-acetyltransferase
MQTIEPLSAWQAWTLGPQFPRWTEHLRNGAEVLIRPLQEGDASAEREFIDSLSPQSRRFRFLGSMDHASDTLVRKLTHLDYQRDLAFAAFHQSHGRDLLVGVSRYSASDDGSSCECAVTVLDQWQGQGLGALLMKHLIELAKGRGIKRMWSIDSAGNTAMTDLARFLGFYCAQDPDDATQVVHSLWLG